LHKIWQVAWAALRFIVTAVFTVNTFIHSWCNSGDDATATASVKAGVAWEATATNESHNFG